MRIEHKYMLWRQSDITKDFYEETQTASACPKIDDKTFINKFLRFEGNFARLSVDSATNTKNMR